MNCEEGMKEKNEMSEERCTCVVREKKKERKGIHEWWRKRNWEWVLHVWWGKKKKKVEREKTKLVLFVCSLCLMQSIEL